MPAGYSDTNLTAQRGENGNKRREIADQFQASARIQSPTHKYRSQRGTENHQHAAHSPY